MGHAALTHALSLHIEGAYSGKGGKAAQESLDNFGFAGGVGVEVAAGSGQLGVEARYTRGFSDLFDLEGNASTINQVWTLALSWMR